jgi:hypothetical protein
MALLIGVGWMNANGHTIFKAWPGLGLLAIIFLSACAPQKVGQGNPTIAAPVTIAEIYEAEHAFPEAPTPLPTSLPDPTAVPSLTPIEDVPLPATPTPAPTASAAAPKPAARPESGQEKYRVAFVTADDVLNVRVGPGVENAINGTFAPDAGDILITGPGQQAAGSIWVPVAGQETQGWANSRYLTGQVASETFCEDAAVTRLLADLETAVANEDGELLAKLVHPQRGLRLHRSWWNPEIYVPQADVNDLFNSSTSYAWGIEDGSGSPIDGSFRELMLPLLQENLLLATAQMCNEIEHGPTAGLVRLPDGYQNVNQVSYFRAANDALGFDWGTWVIGIEFWQSAPVLSYMVFYEYEI